MSLRNTLQTKQVICFILIFLTVGIYWQVLDFDFVGYDDDYFVYENSHVAEGLSGESILWALTDGTRAANYWHPLTWLSHMLDVELYGMAPSGHHLTSLILHTANAVLLFLIFARMTGAVWKSGFVAALFALHPLHVEPVAWVAERKELLGIFFCLLAMRAYLRYVENPRYETYLPVPLFFSFSLMSKATAVTFPFILLLLDFWPLGRWRPGRNIPDIRNGRKPANAARLVWEKSTLFILSGLASVIVLFAEKQGGTVPTLDALPFVTRIGNMTISYVTYIIKMFWPSRLAFYYPYPERIDPWMAVLSGCLLIFLTVLIVRYWRRYPYLVTGWFWYLGTFVPMIGLVQAGSFAMADRFTYLPLTGLFVMIAWGVPELVTGRRRAGTILAVSAVAAILTMLPVTWLQIGHWKNSSALFGHAIKVTKGNWLAYSNMGIAELKAGRLHESADYFNSSLKLRPALKIARYGLGEALSRMGNFDEAAFHYKAAIRIDPDFRGAHFNLGNLFFRQGRYYDAVFHFAEVIRVDPDAAVAYNQIGFILMRLGHEDAATQFFSKTLQLQPDHREAKINLDALKGKMPALEGDTGQTDWSATGS